MDVPNPDMDPESAWPSANNKFGRGAARVVLRRIKKVRNIPLWRHGLFS